MYIWKNASGFGFDNAVNCVEENNGFLYFGGLFRNTNGGKQLNYLAIVEKSTLNIYSVDDEPLGGTDGPITFIKKDPDNRENLIIGGEFDRFTYKTGTILCNHILSLTTHPTELWVVSTHSSIGNLDNFPLTIEYNNVSRSFYVGGRFTTPKLYAFEMTWDTISRYNVGSYLIPSVGTPVTIIYNSPATVGGRANNIYTVDLNNQIYINDKTLTKTSSRINAIIYNQSSPNQELLVATNDAFSAVNPFYYIYTLASTSYPTRYITITDGVIFDNIVYHTQIKLGKWGQSIELIWNASNSKWYIMCSNSTISIS
jgi:hypothetical protein